ncbi:uncharacterized protein V1513DRAFT_459117 [Lipomyces chichibuensis]|uniref:uncharacterized protein n=1 Tax=Lipomyces chichibuensis TaxID=1546026 RepID=UPI0033432A5C
MRTIANRIFLRPAASQPAFVLARHYADLMRPRPGPPRLPQEEQDEFERLLEKANEGTFVPKNAPEQPESEALENPAAKILKAGGAQSGVQPAYTGRTIPEFEGDVNPKTGEIGGPKQDPLRHGDYSFNGRVTDF